MKLFGRIAVGVIVAGANPLAAQAPARFAERVDAYVGQQMAQQKLVGLSLAVMRDGRVVLERGYGFANVEHQVPATPATVYQAQAQPWTIAQGIAALWDPALQPLPDE